MAKNRSISIPDDVAERLDALAAREERSGNWVLNRALTEYLDRQEASEKAPSVEELVEQAVGRSWRAHFASGGCCDHGPGL